MDANLLLADEISVECALRGIDFNSSNRLVELCMQIQKEEMGQASEPNRMHNAAYYNPARELQACKIKTNFHHEWITSSDFPHNFTKLDLNQTESRLLHLSARLKRLGRSRRYGSLAQSVQQRCDKLLGVVQHCRIGNDPQTNASLVEVQQIPSYLVGDLSESEDDERGNSTDEPEVAQQNASQPPSSKQPGPNTSSPTPTVQYSQVPQPGQPIPTQNRFDRGLLYPTVVQPNFSIPPPNIPSFSDRQFMELSERPLATSSHSSSQPAKAPVAGSSQGIAALESTLYPPPSSQPKSVHFQSEPQFSSHYQHPYAVSSVPQQSRFIPPSIPVIQTSHATLRREYQPSDPAVTNDVFGISRPISQFEPAINPRPAINPNQGRFVHNTRTLEKCKIVYDGSPGGIPVESFVFRLESTAFHMGIVGNFLVHEIANVLKGSAEEWYWCHLELNPFITWEQLRIDLIDRFQDRRTTYDIRRLIEDRKQARTESIIEFYQQIRALTLQSRVVFPESEILYYVRRNMRPGLQIALADRAFHSINDLIQSCIALEDTWSRLGYVPERIPSSVPPRRFVHEIEPIAEDNPTYPLRLSTSILSQPSMPLPSVDVVSSSQPPFNSRHVHFTPSPTIPQVRSNNFSTEPLLCWNCYDLGHLYKDCPKAPQHVFCYGCGRIDTIKPRCVACRQQAENSAGRASQSGRISPAPPSYPRPPPTPPKDPRQTVLQKSANGSTFFNPHHRS